MGFLSEAAAEGEGVSLIVPPNTPIARRPQRTALVRLKEVT